MYVIQKCSNYYPFCSLTLLILAMRGAHLGLKRLVVFHYIGGKNYTCSPKDLCPFLPASRPLAARQVALTQPPCITKDLQILRPVGLRNVHSLPGAVGIARRRGLEGVSSPSPAPPACSSNSFLISLATSNVEQFVVLPPISESLAASSNDYRMAVSWLSTKSSSLRKCKPHVSYVVFFS